MKSNRIWLGEKWYHLIKATKKVHGITLEHPYIKEYLETKKEEPIKEEPKKKKVK